LANWSGVSKIIIACFIKQSNDLKSFRKYDFNIFLITDRLSQRRCAGYSFLESLAFLFKTQFIKNLKHMKVYGMLTVEELQQQWLPDSTEFATRPNHHQCLKKMCIRQTIFLKCLSHFRRHRYCLSKVNLH